MPLSQQQDAGEGLAKKFNMPYVKNKWIGGLITNFKILSGRIEHYKNSNRNGKREYGKYTKKERVVISKDVAKMKKCLADWKILQIS